MDSLRCLFEIQVEKYGFHCALSVHYLTHPLLMATWVVSSFASIGNATISWACGFVGVFLREQFQAVEAQGQRLRMSFKFILPNGCSKRFHQFIFPPEVHKNVKIPAPLPTMDIINLFKKPLPI